MHSECLVKARLEKPRRVLPCQTCLLRWKGMNLLSNLLLHVLLNLLLHVPLKVLLSVLPNVLLNPLLRLPLNPLLKLLLTHMQLIKTAIVIG